MGTPPDPSILQDPMAMKRYMVYVHPDCEPSTRLSATIFKSSHLKALTKIQSIKELSAPLPEWMIGTPTVVKRSDGSIYRGRDAFNLLNDV